MFNKLKKAIKQGVRIVQSFHYKEKKYSPPHQYQVGEIYIFIRSWNRPLYLWTCLDNLYRVTKRPCHFILIDNASTDPLVKKIIQGFERRGMFKAVHFMERNHGSNQQLVFSKYRKEIGKYFFLIDADITIEPSLYCWTDTMIEAAEQNTNLGLLGSYLDTADFVSLKEARQLEPALDEPFLEDLIKWNSNERRTPPKTAEIINPFKPAGRLLLAKTTAIDKVGLPIGNANLCRVVKAAGYDEGISTRVVHRHLSLLNIYDYPDYDFAQLNKYLKGK
jgi:GT2 family glycosyltransferase